jgi:thiosulfate reductase cytochrome b subunit
MTDLNCMDGRVDIGTESAPAAHRRIHGLYVRIAHWINAVAIIVMIGSGWEIYNASPLFDFVFPRSITLGGWLAGALLWHFAAMWIFIVNGLVYILFGFTGGHLRRRFLPVRLGEALGDAVAALRGKLRHDDPFSYNAAQRLLYLAVLLAGLMIVATGFAIWKPVQLQWLTAIFGGYENARLLHFFSMIAIVLFFIVHVLMALLVPKSLRAMIRGY